MQAELRLVDSFAEVEAFRHWLGERRPILAFDSETTGLDPRIDHIKLAQFGDARTGWAIPWRDWRGIVRETFADLKETRTPVVMHNAKYDVSMLEADGVHPDRGLIHDTSIMVPLADSESPRALKPAAGRWVDKAARAPQRELQEGMAAHGWNWATVPETFEPYWMYAAIDPILTAQLAEVLWPKIQHARDAYELEREVLWPLLDLETRGTRVDVEYCRSMRNQLQVELNQIEGRWIGVNLHSSAQVMDLLREAGYTFTKTTEKGALTLDEEVLSAIDHPLARDTLAARDRRKTIRTYLDGIVRFQTDGLLHFNVNPMGARTGRMSINKPSMQNLPRNKTVRDAFLPRAKNEVLLLADWQAQETRLIAHFSRDPAMMRAFSDGVDIHTFVASQVYGVRAEDVSSRQRFLAKTAGHARNYGAGPSKISLITGQPTSATRPFCKAYDAEFPGIPRLHREIIAALKDRKDDMGRGYVTTYAGRRLWVDIKKGYTACNTLVQGSGADMMKRAIVNADRMGLGQFLVVPVHDELALSVPSHLVDEATSLIHEAMELEDFRVPMPVETKTVERWGDAYAA